MAAGKWDGKMSVCPVCHDPGPHEITREFPGTAACLLHCSSCGSDFSHEEGHDECTAGPVAIP